MSRCEDSPEHTHAQRCQARRAQRIAQRCERYVGKKTSADGTGYDGMICVISFFNKVPI